MIETTLNVAAVDANEVMKVRPQFDVSYSVCAALSVDYVLIDLDADCGDDHDP